MEDVKRQCRWLENGLELRLLTATYKPLRPLLDHPRSNTQGKCNKILFVHTESIWDPHGPNPLQKVGPQTFIGPRGHFQGPKTLMANCLLSILCLSFWLVSLPTIIYELKHWRLFGRFHTKTTPNHYRTGLYLFLLRTIRRQPSTAKRFQSFALAQGPLEALIGVRTKIYTNNIIVKQFNWNTILLILIQCLL